MFVSSNEIHFNTILPSSDSFVFNSTDEAISILKNAISLSSSLPSVNKREYKSFIATNEARLCLHLLETLDISSFFHSADILWSIGTLRFDSKTIEVKFLVDRLLTALTDVKVIPLH